MELQDGVIYTTQWGLQVAGSSVVCPYNFVSDPSGNSGITLKSPLKILVVMYQEVSSEADITLDWKAQSFKKPLQVFKVQSNDSPISFQLTSNTI